MIETIKSRKFNRRKFITTGLVTMAALTVADAKWVEPTWVNIRRLRISDGKPTHRLVHFTDVHHKGDRPYLQSVVNQINALSPDFVCFTGDIMEQKEFLAEALEVMGGIKSPLYGVPGNHDYWSFSSFGLIQQKFAATGGGWLLDQQVQIGDTLNLIGLTCNRSNRAVLPVLPDRKNIVLMHYPAWVKVLAGQKCDLMLAGHSHGGQVRIPLYGSIMVPFMVDGFDLGLFHTHVGPLYVNPGIGYIGDFSLRFNCRPEITVIDV